MEIEHKLKDTQVEYGYIWWKKKGENNKYRKVFPVADFTLYLDGKKFTKHVDWNMGRVSIGKTIMQRLFKQDDTIIISKIYDNTVFVRKRFRGERIERKRNTNKITRVHLLARELNVKSTAIIEKCQEHKFDIKNNMSSVSQGLARLILEWFSKPK